jgi:iron complex transport system substrate-binding protein
VTPWRGAAIALAATAAVVPALAQAFPVTVTSGGEPVTFREAPRRAVFHDQNLIGMAIALGLQSSLVGVTGFTGWRPPDPAMRAALGAVPELAPRQPSLEVLLAARPDLVVAGWHYGMRPGGDVTPASLDRFGIRTLVLTESCAHVDTADRTATMALLYDDVLRLGRVFGVEDRARRLVESWRARIDAAARPADPATAPRVFVYDSGDDRPFTAGRAAMPTALIAAAGGRNVTADLRGSWIAVSWEAVAARDPQWIVLVDDGDGRNAARLESTLRAHPAMRHTSAVRDRRTIVLRYVELVPGPANVDAVEKLAAALHGTPR